MSKYRKPLRRSPVISLYCFCLLAAVNPAAAMADITSVTVESQAASSRSAVPVTFGQAFARGEVVDPDVLGARLDDGTVLELQVDSKATHRDGSLRHAVLTTILPELGGGDASRITLFAPGNAASGGSVRLADLLASDFDATVSLNVGGTTYTASARDLLQNSTPRTWLEGPAVSEWQVSGAVTSPGGNAHPHLTARFGVRAYSGLGSVRLSVTIENNWAFEPSPSNFTYDASVTVQGRGEVLSQSSATHYRQARWRRVFWWGDAPEINIAHDTGYLERMGIVPTYDPRLSVPAGSLAQMESDWTSNRSRLMATGFIYSYMPEGGGRPDIAPLPRWTARYLMTQDSRARKVMLGTGEQAGSFSVHYRDRDTDLPISLDTYPNATILGTGSIFPSCGGSCNTPYEPDVAHQPSMSYVPYLVTGDWYHLEELQFWANWNLFYWGDHGGSQGLMVYDQIRSQAWGLRTLGHAAYITPDDHPMKSYFISKLINNLNWYDRNYSDNPPTSLGYLLNPSGLGVDNSFATWMDDFFTWTVGHLANLGFAEAEPIFNYKAAFPVGRMTDPGYCWILAPTYWTRSRDPDTGQAYTDWADYKEGVIRAWDGSGGPSFAESAPNMTGGQEDALIAAACNSSEMAGILGLRRDEMIGYSWSHEGYVANLQPAVAMVAERNAAGGDAAWSRFDSRSVVPDSGNYDYNVSPQWAIVPAALNAGGSPVDPLPLVSLSANPSAIGSGESTTLSWSSSYADSCEASGGWSGARSTSGSTAVGPLDSDTTFTLACSNAEGTSSDSVTITVSASPPPAPQPTLDFSASETTVDAGGSVTLTWSAQDADSCEATGAWTGSRGPSGSESSPALDADSTFTLSCSGAGGEVSSSVSVTVTSGSSGSGGSGGSGGGDDGSSGSSGSSDGGGGSLGGLGLLVLGMFAAVRRFGIASGTRRLGALAVVAGAGSLSGCLDSGGESADAAGATGGAGEPTTSLTASPAAVESGGTTMLSWSSTNSDSCSASGAWGGDKPTAGTEQSSALSSDAAFTLTCSGAGGNATETVSVTVNAAAEEPTLTLNVSPGSVVSGGSATLSWDASNAAACEASGDWSGSRPSSGQESTGPLSASSSFSLRCTGSGGEVTRTVNVSVTASDGSVGISGAVDSSLIDRSGDNRVYVFAGDVVPDDFDGSDDPLLSLSVTQDVGACTFGYASGELSDGDYTVAFTPDAALDDPSRDDNLEFHGTTLVTVAGSGTALDFPAESIIRVGPGRAYQTVAQAAAAAQNGDVVEIDAGLYAADVASWYQDDLTLRGVGGYAHLRADGANAQGKAIWVIAGSNVSVENIEFSEATVPDQNGAGIRHDGFNLVVCNGYFHDSETGILGGAGEVLVEYSEFDNNGFGDGFSHNMYILDADRFTLRHSYSHHAIVGHNVKSRARENYILYNRLMDEGDGNSSYALDLPNGGLSFVIGNLMQQGPNTDNSAIVNYGTEGLPGGRTHNLYIVNNTLVDDRGNGTFLQAAGGSSLIRLVNNLLVGSGTLVSGASAETSGNLQTTAPGLADVDGFDYRLTAASPAIDAGVAPGSGDGQDLTPIYQYLHEQNREDRPSDGTIDIGAYEYTQ